MLMGVGLSRALGALLSLLLAPSMAFSLDPSVAISQYGHAMWTLQDGVLPGAPTAMTQTIDGYLWIGTRNGLVRFDGVRFVPFSAPADAALPSNRILSLQGARDGSLWIGTRAGLARWHAGRLSILTDTAAQIPSIAEDQAGKIWFTRMSIRDDKGPLCEVAGDKVVCHGAGNGVPIDIARQLEVDAQGNIWTVSDNTLMRWKEGVSQTWLPPGLSHPGGPTLQDVVHSLALAPGGTVWVGAMQPSRGLGLLRLENDRLVNYTTPALDGRRLSVSPILVDSGGTVWIGTQDEGVYRLHDGKVSHFRRSDGLSSDTVQNLFEDREGTIWVLTTQGIDAFRDLRVASVGSRQGLAADLANGVLAARDGTVWIDNWHSLDAWRDGKVTSLSSRNGLPGEEVMGLFEDPSGALWVGVDHQLAIFEGGRFQLLRHADGRGMGTLSSAAVDAAGDIWVMTAFPDQLLRFRDRKVIESISRETIPFAFRALTGDRNAGIWVPLQNGDLGRWREGRLEVFEFHRKPNTATIIALASFPDGAVVGATALGVAGWRDGRTQTMTAANGLPCVDIHSLLIDGEGALWLYAGCGLVYIAAEQVRTWWNNPAARLTTRVFDAFDGAQPARANFFPKASLGPDGRLWFANASVVQVVDPRRLASNTVKPPVQIEQLWADRNPFPASQNLRLAPNTRDLQIDYTGLSFVVPRKTRFRYRLEGHDSRWQDAGTRRQAFFTDLPPRDYVFHVTASNNDGVWNNSGARIAFSIAPTFYQTRWFTALCIFGALGALWMVFMWRVRQMEQRVRLRAEERIEERERIARELHDTLLQGLLSASLQLSVANSKIEADAPAKSLVERIGQLLRQVIDEGRDAVRGLRASQGGSEELEQALARIPDDLANKGAHFRLLVEGTARALRPAVRDEAYRISREALANAFRHSGAQSIEAVLDYSADRFRLAVRDNGCGIDTGVLQSGREGHWGLSGMRERAQKIGGSLKVLSARGAGTEIDLTVPASAAFEGQPRRRWTDWLGRFHWRGE
jgi:signal transduction histidine kinase/ligand-binding sensor domain-containing protein